MKLCRTEKCCSKLADVMKVSCDSGVVLDKVFYRSVLEELQQWGQDRDALAMVTKNLRVMEEGGEWEGKVGDSASSRPTSLINGNTESHSKNCIRERLVSVSVTW